MRHASLQPAFDPLQLLDRFDIVRPAQEPFGHDEIIDRNNAAAAPEKRYFHGIFRHAFEVANAADFSQKIDLAQVGTHVEVSDIG